AERELGLKQEKVPGEEWSSCGAKQDSLLKEEALPNTELRERWAGCLDVSTITNASNANASNTSWLLKSFSEQELQQCQDDWGGLNHRVPEGDPGDPTDPLYRPRYSMEELGGGFEKSGYGAGFLVPPSRLGALSYGAVGHYQVNLGGSEGGDHHHRSHMTGPHQSMRERMGSTNAEVGDLNCLLINEEGYPEHGVPDMGSRAGQRGLTSIHSGRSAHNNKTESLYGAADDFGHSLNLRDRSQEQVTGGGGRRHACNQCTMTFPDSGSLKAHKEKHKTGRWSSLGPGRLYSRTQCAVDEGLVTLRTLVAPLVAVDAGVAVEALEVGEVLAAGGAGERALPRHDRSLHTGSWRDVSVETGETVGAGTVPAVTTSVVIGGIGAPALTRLVVSRHTVSGVLYYILVNGPEGDGVVTAGADGCRGASSDVSGTAGDFGGGTVEERCTCSVTNDACFSGVPEGSVNSVGDGEDWTGGVNDVAVPTPDCSKTVVRLCETVMVVLEEVGVDEGVRGWAVYPEEGYWVTRRGQVAGALTLLLSPLRGLVLPCTAPGNPSGPGLGWAESLGGLLGVWISLEEGRCGS
ncbi:unnamed protein product, partial [Coregonus sp. 'balchen']